MRIERFDAVTADEATALAFAALLADARRCVTPLGTTLPAPYVLNRLRHTSEDFRGATWVAYDGERMTGSVEAYWREAPDNRDRAWVHLDVPDADADERLLDALAGEAAAHCAASGRTVLTVEVEAGSPHSAWLGARGGRLGALDEHNVLPLDAVSRADLEALTATPPAGYELLTWDAPTPADLIDGYVRLVDSLNDAPNGELTLERAVYSPARLRDWESGLLARGHALWVTVARHVETGDLAAYNQLEIRPEWPEVVENQDTAVAGPHRGHGLGLWVKAVNLLRVLDELPGAVCVSTWNSAGNEHMLRVNRRLGFVRQHVVEQWELDTAAILDRGQ